MFRAEIRVIDHAKRTAMSHALLDNVTSTAPGEKLDEKLANLIFSNYSPPELPPPSSDDVAWWDRPEHPGGVFASPTQHPFHESRKSNPFNSPADSPLSSPSSSEEELYNTLQAPLAPQLAQPATRRPPPPPPPRVTRPPETRDVP
ncbi:hypothetical protein PHLCEN_2v1577 [Hermanssonia centrifuga]|uniref:Uncharacterized protein n=1 Tax=Hermanssonia centrifuga TaxID=98765 RepID=A0A2R6RZF3_9APHY|nr:hypothetical protein PHLCEN_2v1577 [Hermanssonia centrifuga]